MGSESNITIIIGQEVNGPLQDLIDNFYNLVWLQKLSNGSYQGCYREGITFSQHHTGKMVRIHNIHTLSFVDER